MNHREQREDCDGGVSALQETDWSVLKEVLDKLPQVLQNKTMVLSADVGELEKLTFRLCDLVRIFRPR